MIISYSTVYISQNLEKLHDKNYILLHKNYILIKKILNKDF